MPIKGRRTILIVDDEREACSILQEFFRRLGYNVSTADEGSMALDRIRRERPSLVLLDIRMSGMSGIEVLKALHQEQVPCRAIVVTAVQDDAVWREAKRYGASSCLTKPFNLEELRRLVEEQFKVLETS